MQQLADILRSSGDISEDARRRIPVGKPGERLAGKHYKVDNKKARLTLELEQSSLENAVIGLAAQLLEIEKT
jgi:hypothetical protein